MSHVFVSVMKLISCSSCSLLHIIRQVVLKQNLFSSANSVLNASKAVISYAVGLGEIAVIVMFRTRFGCEYNTVLLPEFEDVSFLDSSARKICAGSWQTQYSWSSMVAGRL